MPPPKAESSLPREVDDPFGTAALREATLAGWQQSPTRLDEDAAAEAELLDIGYRDRLITELCANAADAASAAGVMGRLDIRVGVSGTRIHMANTGAPLTAEGVRSLTALRVSPKRAVHDGVTVGRFGLGFRATSLARRVTIASRSGAIVFDAARSRHAIAERIPSAADAPLPTQRLAWPIDAEPPAGFDTVVVLDLDDAAIAAGIVEQAARQAPDLLLELDSIDTIAVDGHVYVRRDDDAQVVIHRDGDEHRRWWRARTGDTSWLVPVRSGRVRPLSGDVLRSPTATGIDLTLPARLITHLPLTPDRRDLHPDARIADAADGYPALLELVPDDQKHLLIPPPALAAGRVDAVLRDAVRTRIAEASWVPSAAGPTRSPQRSWVLPGLTAALADLLAEILDPLAHPDVSDRVTAGLLVGLGARQVGLADLADLLTGVDRPDEWWARLYSALAGVVGHARDVDDLGALPVPRADGRLHVGARGLFVVDGLAEIDDPPVPAWVPTVAPAAYDPLLERMGLARLSLAEVLDHPGLAAELDRLDDDPEGDAGPKIDGVPETGGGLDDLVDTVLRLLALPDAGPAPAALGRLEIPASDGERWPADELLLPDSPLAAVLVEDSPFGTVSDATVATYGSRALRRLGVGWGFSVIIDPEPVAPDHDLPDEEQWWEEHEVPPDDLVAVRDLDLVDPNRWRQALALLIADEQTAPLLAGGYTRWWLRRYAEIDRTPLRRLRAVDDDAYRGLFDAVELPPAAAGLLVGAVPDDADDADAWLTALADPAREVAPGVAQRAHAALVEALAAGNFAVADVTPPPAARTLAGGTTTAPIVVDAPWWAAVVPADRAVLPGLPPTADAAAMLADLLDADTASDRFVAVPGPDGEDVDPDSPVAVALLAAAGHPRPRRLSVHEDLHVQIIDDDVSEPHRVAWWVDDDATLHLSRYRSR